MESVTSEEELDELSDRRETYSADVSALESCSGYSHDHEDDEDSTNSFRSSVAAECCHSSKFSLRASIPAVLSPSTASEVDRSKAGEVELMKERFAKLLLGEDLSGGGKGVCTALAISNAISDLSVTIFGDLWKLEPLPPPTKSAWWREMAWLLSVTDFIVEFSPSKQEFPGGGTFEVMTTHPRGDLNTYLPELKKLDSTLLSILDGFENSDFYYVDRAVIVADANQLETCSSFLSSSSSRSSVWKEEKWWAPFPKVPANGLCKNSRKKLQDCRKFINQILKAVVTMNSAILADMEVPTDYLESLPKCIKAYIGDRIYESLSSDKFYPDFALDDLQLSSELTMSEVASRVDAAASIWRHKYLNKEVPAWRVRVKGIIGDTDKKKNKIVAQRAETLMQTLRLRFPDLPQTDLDTKKIRNNKDVGKAILESYSRVLKQLAMNIVARIDDLIYIDDATKRHTQS